MNISADIVKKLRDITGAGMMECKKALIDAQGNMDDAIRILKEKGLADAKKRADRETKEGGVFIKKSGDNVALIQLACETDFVSNSDVFKNANNKILDSVLSLKSEDPSKYTDFVQEVISQTKENIELKVVKLINLSKNQYASTYIHGNNKIGVVAIFEIEKEDLKNNSEMEEFGLNIAMHIAASSPLYLDENEIPDKEREEQKAIFMKQMEGSDKPANVIENIVKGKLSKYFAEVCLLEQKYVKDDKITVSKYIEDFSKKVGSKIKIVKFYRYMIGS
ncbi:MAG TPA: translation elongation factor Ts [Spirochaetota bacterium]|nr:translation elongation factor Ts [Spirochaetota bacterium]HOL57461.1 translation elongation factor Ts [Spirochaetota bacterium]HPP04384.1 translation elongation factor Ts [Spirochaetota bacterium]